MLTKAEWTKEYNETKESYEKALKVQIKLEAKYLTDNGYVNEDDSIPGSIAEIKNMKLRNIAFDDFNKNHRTQEVIQCDAAKNTLEYITRKLIEAGGEAA